MDKKRQGEDMRWSVTTSVVGLMMLVACQTSQAPTTASGRPEITVTGIQPQQLKAVIVNKMIDKGYRIVRDDALNVVLDRPVDGIMEGVPILGARSTGAPIVFANFTITDVGGSVRAVADMTMVVNLGNPYWERRIDLSKGEEAPKIQAVLNQAVSEAIARQPKRTAAR